MGARHVTDLFSAAYDDALSPAERRRYDDHLATCEDCAAGAEEFRQTIDAVHSLARVRMPQRVVLPATPPQLERSRRPAITWPARLPRPRITPAWGAGSLAAAGLAAAILLVHAHVGGPSALSATSGATRQQGASDAQAQGAGSAPRATAGIGTCPLPLAVIPQPAALPSQPPGFSNATVATAPQRPGEQLVLATTATKVSPGSQVLIYAALTSTGAHRSAVIPCVSLHSQGAVAFAPATTTTGGEAAGQGTAQNATNGSGQGSSGNGGSAGSAAGGPAASPAPNGAAAPPVAVAGGPAALNAPQRDTSLGGLLTPDQVAAFAPYSLLPPLAVASPTSAAVATLPLQVVEIPKDILPGTRLQLVALVPSGLPGSGDSPAVEAVLTLEVS